MVGSVCSAFEVEFGPCKFIGFVNVGNGRVVCWDFQKSVDAAVEGGVFVWKVLKEEWFERKVGV